MKKEEEQRDAELAAYYQEQWANEEEEEEAAAEAAAAETAPLYGASGLRCGVTENPGWGEFFGPPTLYCSILHREILI